jgi:hypothetical protein
MSAFEEFEKDLTRAALDLIAAAPPNDHAVVRYSIGRYLGIPDKSPPPEARELSPREKFIEQLFFAFVEILNSVESLRNVSIYIRRFPHRRAGVEKTAYLRYHVENYLSELYILKNRMKAFLTIISRRYRSDPHGNQITHASKQISEHFDKAFASVVLTRGAHVHERRFDDFDLSRLTLFRIISSETDAGAAEYQEVYRQVRRTKRLWIETTNRSVEQLLDAYFNTLKTLVFDDNGNLRIPNELPNKTSQPTA